MPLVIVKTKHTTSEVWPFLDLDIDLVQLFVKRESDSVPIGFANSRPFYNKPVKYFSSL